MDEARIRLLAAVADAARGYRAAMRRYIDVQARLLDGGVALDEVTERNWGGFAETMRAEEQLYDAIDALESLDEQPIRLSQSCKDMMAK